MPSHLGIDIGTTSVKVCIIRDGVRVNSLKVVHEANTTPQEQHSSAVLFDEQNPRIILKVLNDCMSQLKHLFNDISEISVTGQMHGVLLWKRKLNVNVTDMHIDSIFDALVSDSSNLITWQDQRCDSSFIDQLPPSPPFCNIATGFGIATLAWLQKEFKNLDQYDMCGTIMDLITWLLTESDDVMMTSHNANSWGYFDINKGCWEIEKIKELNLDVNIIPKIVPVHHPVGHLKWSLYGIKTNAIVHAALGDMQCSICASQPSNNEAVIHIGTSSQLSFITQYEEEDMKELTKKYPAISIVPYKGNDVIISAASLSGGNVINNFVTNLQSWMTELGCMNIPHKNEVFKKLEHSASTYKENHDTQIKTLNIVPRIFGERFDPGSCGSVTNINSSNCTLGAITYAIYEGIIRNLSDMLPVDVLKKYGAEGVIATGGAFVDNGVLRKLVMEVYELKVRVMNDDDDDGAFGAAMFLDNVTKS